MTLSILAGSCSAGPPPYVEDPSLPPGPTGPVRPGASARATATVNTVEPAVPALDALARAVVRGPHPSLEAICGAGCTLGRELPALATMDRAAIAVGTDATNMQPPSVKSTYVVMRVGSEWFGTLLFREGTGALHLEVFNPPNMNGGSPSRVDRPVQFGGSLLGADVLAREGAAPSLLAITATRSEGVPMNVLLLCEARAEDGSPRCAELETELLVVGEKLEGDVVFVTFTDGLTTLYRVFGDSARGD